MKTHPTRRSRAAAAALSAPAGELPPPGRTRCRRQAGADLAGRVEALAVELDQVGAELEIHARTLRRRQPEESAAFTSAAAGAFALARRLHTLVHFVSPDTSIVSDAGAGSGPARASRPPRDPDPAPGSLTLPLGGGLHGDVAR